MSLKDNKSLKYEVYALPNQENSLTVGERISCLVEDISFNVKLKQVNFQVFISHMNQLIQIINHIKTTLNPI